MISVHVQSICDAVDVPHLETHPTLDSALFRGANVFLNRSSSSIVPSGTNLDQRFSINVHPRLEDINVAFRDLVLYKKWPKAALLYTGMRDGDGSGASTFHLQHMLLQNDVDCLTRRLPAIYDVSVSYSYVEAYHECCHFPNFLKRKMLIEEETFVSKSRGNDSIPSCPLHHYRCRSLITIISY